MWRKANEKDEMLSRCGHDEAMGHRNVEVSGTGGDNSDENGTRNGLTDQSVTKQTKAANAKGVRPGMSEIPGFKIRLDEHVPLWLFAFFMGTMYMVTISANILIINHLPAPKIRNQSLPGEFVEEGARQYLDGLVSVGARPAGSFENDVYAMKYIQDAVKEIQISAKTNKRIEMDVQRPSGSFFMPFLDDFTSYYANVTNTVVKISSPESDGNALLLNCHTDSVINSPGASDDGVACAVLLEILRAIAAEKTPLRSPLILLFNGAEENILQGSHGFITQHKWATEVKAFINLEAAGAGGKECLFQTGPENPWLIWTWAKHAPYPTGASVGQDLFQSGVIPADTDFRIFRDYGNVPGIDLAYIRNGYVYHTLHDSPAMIHPGSIQRAGENILAVVRHLVQSPDSLLPDPSEYRHGDAAYFDVFGIALIVIPLRILTIVNHLTIFLVVLRIYCRIRNPNVSGYDYKEYIQTLILAMVTTVLGFVLCILGLCAVATILTVTGHSLPWYSTPSLAFILYVPAGLLGYVFLLSYPKEILFKQKYSDVRRLDAVFTDAQCLIWSCIIYLLRNIGSSYLFVVPLIFFLIRHQVASEQSPKKGWADFSRLVSVVFRLVPNALAIYQVMQISSVLTGLAARAGSDTPPEIFMVVLFGLAMLLCVSLEISAIVVVKSAKWFHVTMVMLLCSAFCISFSNLGFPYNADPNSPTTKRFYMQHVQRQFFDAGGALDREDSGMFICHMDYLIKDHHLGPDIVMNADFHQCKGTYCEMPFLLPIQKMVGSTQYIPASPPTTLATTDLYPLELTWKGESTQSVGGGLVVKIHVAVKGPPDMAIHIAPVLKGSLVGWSFESDIRNAHSKYSAAETYFILYGGGMVHPVWNFWLEFSFPDDRAAGKPILELGLTAHYQPSGPATKVNTQTKELESITSQLHDWVAPMTWVSLYRNYKI